MVKIILFFVLFILVVVFFSSPRVRSFVRHIPHFLRQFPKDLYYNHKFKKKNNAPVGFIRAYCAESNTPFGSGKTLSSVKWVYDVYNRYNGLMVWNGDKFVPQYIMVFSNIDLAFPHIRINSLSEYSDFISHVHDNSECVYVSYLFIDEAGSEFNSRAFSKNFSPDFISDIVTCRHNRSAFIYTAQDFSLVDKLLRTVTTQLFLCSHWNRLFFLRGISPRQAEEVSDTSVLNSLSFRSYFATDKLYSLYDTLSRFKRLESDVAHGAYRSPQEILELRGDSDVAYKKADFTHKGKKFFKKFH